MATTSTDGLLVVLRTRLMTFEPLDGSEPLSRRLSGGLNLITVPDTAPAPYGALRLINGLTSGRTHMERVACELEALWFHSPRAKARELEGIADVADQALLRWWHADADGGWLRVVGRRRDTMRAPARSEADEELVQVRQLFELVVWPSLLTQYADVA